MHESMPNPSKRTRNAMPRMFLIYMRPSCRCGPIFNALFVRNDSQQLRTIPQWRLARVCAARFGCFPIRQPNHAPVIAKTSLPTGKG